MKFTVKQVRLMADKTQHEMAEELGIGVDTYRRIERNPNSATVEQAKQISNIVGISYDIIFFGTDSILNRVEP